MLIGRKLDLSVGSFFYKLVLCQTASMILQIYYFEGPHQCILLSS